MRITGGIYSGRTIAMPKGIIRPAMDRMRESVFSILGTDLSGSSFLDLFSGSGIIGIEAASRGATPVVLVEMDKKKRPTMETNIAFVESNIRIFTMSAMKFLSRCTDRFDYIFIDPPFKFTEKESLISKIGVRNVLADHGTVLMHHPTREEIASDIPGFTKTDARKYGGSEVLFFTLNA